MTVVTTTRRPSPTPSTSHVAVGAANTRLPEETFSSDYFVSRTAARPRRTPRQTGLLGQLNREWSTVLGARALPATWTQFAALAECGCSQDVLDAISRAASSQDADAILHALLTLHQAGDELAGRAVLQTMLGKVARTAVTAHNRGVVDHWEASLAAMWTAIRTYPLARTRSVAATLGLNALRQLGKQNATDAAEAWSLEVLEDQHGYAQPAEPADGGFDTVLVQTLTWAADHQVLTRAEIQLIARAHLPASGKFVARMTELADEMGVTAGCLQQRHQRAVTKLAAAVAAAMWAPGADLPTSATSSVLVVAPTSPSQP